MSTVLTNGVIIPENGSRNWGGDLANNWNILDVNVGYMTDVKNRVTTLENSVAENTANIQINASNISALQTSKQDAIEDLETIREGATAGATAVQPSALSDYVDLSSEQTISGAKTFQQNITYQRTNFFHQAVSPCYYLKDTELEKGSLASTHAAYPGLWVDKNGNALGYVRFVEYSSGRQTAEFRLINFIKNGALDPTGSDVICGVNLELQPTGEKSLIPEQNNDINLGTSTNKWKTVNGINPGALSLPDHNSYLDIKGNLPASVSDNSWISRSTITPEQDGILILNFLDCSGAVVWNSQDLPSYGDRSTSISLEKRVMAFVLKGVSYGIYTTNYSQIATARLFYCQGNV